LSFDAIFNISVKASTFPQAQGQKSFGSFLQKRTFFLPNSLISLDFSPDRHSEKNCFLKPLLCRSVHILTFARIATFCRAEDAPLRLPQPTPAVFGGCGDILVYYGETQ
jgi:hypothetical protein